MDGGDSLVLSARLDIYNKFCCTEQDIEMKGKSNNDYSIPEVKFFDKVTTMYYIVICEGRMLCFI